MSYNPQNPNGQATMANSAPVVIASNQTAVPVTFTGAGTPNYQYAEDNAVPTTSETTVLSYVVPALTTLHIQGVVVTGSATMRYKLKINGTTYMTLRTSAADRTRSPFLGDGTITATTGQTVTITAFHEEATNMSAECALFGYTT